MAAYNRKTKKAIPLSLNTSAFVPNDVLWQSTSGPPRILLSQGSQVFEVDVVTGKRKLVQPPHGFVAGWYADGDGNIRMGTYFHPDKGKLVALYRQGGRGGFRTIIREKVGRYDEPPVPLIFLPGDKALVTSRSNGFSELYEIDLTTMQLGRKVYGASGYDIAAVEADPARKALERVTIVDDRRRHIYFEPRLKEIQAVLDETFGAGAAEIASVDAGAESIVVKVGGPDQAGAYYLFRTASGDLKRIGWVNAELKDMKLNSARTVRYPTGDGRTVSAVLTMPRLKGGRNLPLIVLPHGGPFGTRDYETWDMWAQPLAELGYAVIQPNFLGSGGFGKQWEAGSDGAWAPACRTT